MNNKDMPAMPTDSIGNSGAPYYKPTKSLGLTKREMFAMHAMEAILQGALSNGKSIEYDDVSRAAILQADALLAALETE